VGHAAKLGDPNGQVVLGTPEIEAVLEGIEVAAVDMDSDEVCGAFGSVL
jgi:hypothetical protein